MENRNGYDNSNFVVNELAPYGDSGWNPSTEIKPYKGSAKKDMQVYDFISPVFFSQQFRGLTEIIMTQCRTWQEIKKEKELTSGRSLGREEGVIYRRRGDEKYGGFIKEVKRGEIHYVKYLPQSQIYIGITKNDLELIRKSEGESKYNWKVFNAIYEMIYVYLLRRYDGETHFERHHYNYITLRKTDIFKKLGWNENRKWDRMKLQNGLDFLQRAKFFLSFQYGKMYERGEMNLSPFLLNFTTLPDCIIAFNVNSYYFCQVEKHIRIKIKELKGEIIQGESLPNVFEGESLPPYYPQLASVNGISPESHSLLTVFSGYRDVVTGSLSTKVDKNIQTDVKDLIWRLGRVSNDPKKIGRSIEKLFKYLEELKQAGLIYYSNEPTKRKYGNLNRRLNIRVYASAKDMENGR